MDGLPVARGVAQTPLDPAAPTAVILVGGYGGVGIHALLSVQRLFPGHFRNVLFVSAAVIDAASMKGAAEVDRVCADTRAALERYAELARGMGLAAGWRMDVGTEAVAGAERLCLGIGREMPRAVFFMGKLISRREGWLFRVLHNNTAEQLQRRLQFDGLNAMLLPIRVIDGAPKP